MVIFKRKRIKNFGFNSKNSTYIIAEIGINHDGNLNTAKDLIRSAAKTGCDAVKFQTYKTENRVKNKKSLIFDILKKCELKLEDFYTLKKFSKKNNIDFFSTPFDIESAKYLKNIGVNFFKIASFDVTNQVFLRKVARLRKPVIFSTGMCNLKEVSNAHKIFSRFTKKVTIMHCVSSYPLDPKNADLNCIKTLSNKFNCLIGYSDHTNSIDVPLYAVAAGAQVIEKHYMINKKMNCVDKAVSITEKDMKEMVKKIRFLENVLGSGSFQLRKSEKNIVQFRRKS